MNYFIQETKPIFALLVFWGSSQNLLIPELLLIILKILTTLVTKVGTLMWKEKKPHWAESTKDLGFFIASERI